MALILLVEDNEMNRDMLSRRLRRRGHEVVTAEDGFTAVSMAESALPELVLMDLSLRAIDGLEATLLSRRDSSSSGFLPIRNAKRLWA